MEKNLIVNIASEQHSLKQEISKELQGQFLEQQSEIKIKHDALDLDNSIKEEKPKSNLVKFLIESNKNLRKKDFSKLELKNKPKLEQQLDILNKHDVLVDTDNNIKEEKPKSNLKKTLIDYNKNLRKKDFSKLELKNKPKLE